VEMVVLKEHKSLVMNLIFLVLVNRERFIKILQEVISLLDLILR
jgi:hypothetical protein